MEGVRWRMGNGKLIGSRVGVIPNLIGNHEVLIEDNLSA